MLRCWIYLFFFFQAEDGIRDVAVTGVQTCALPIFFLGCNGIDPKGGITNINLPEAEIKRRMLRAARRRIVVADGSKVGEVELAFLCSVDEIDLLITDSSADPTVLSALREYDLEVMIA